MAAEGEERISFFLSLGYLFRQMTRSIGGIENLVVVDGVVERQAEANGMRRLQLRPRHVERLLVRLLRLVR